MNPPELRHFNENKKLWGDYDKNPNWIPLKSDKRSNKHPLKIDFQIKNPSVVIQTPFRKEVPQKSLDKMWFFVFSYDFFRHFWFRYINRVEILSK